MEKALMHRAWGPSLAVLEGVEGLSGLGCH